jgi:hypothetical protein
MRVLAETQPAGEWQAAEPSLEDVYLVGVAEAGRG